MLYIDGMTVQNPLKPNYIFQDGSIIVDESQTIDDLIAEYHKHGWLEYQVGVWCTAYARLKLELAIHSIPFDNFVYADTDSVKYIDDGIDHFKELNKQFKHEEYSALDRNGKRHYIGILESDGKYKRFKTLGCKRYVYEDMDDNLHITISGVGKKEGVKELGCIENFNEGFTFTKSAGPELIYNDEPPIHRVKIDGHDVEIISNIAIYDSTYTLSMSEDYKALLDYLSEHDIAYSLHYKNMLYYKQ